jgi:hypothetical protein
MWLSLQFCATYCLLWLSFYATCPRQLDLIKVICDNYDYQLIINPIVDLLIPCNDSMWCKKVKTHSFKKWKCVGIKRNHSQDFPIHFHFWKLSPQNNEIYKITILGLQQLGSFGIFYHFDVAHNTIYKLYYRQESDSSSQV